MAQYLWQTSLTSAALKIRVVGANANRLTAGDASAEHFGGRVLHIWLADGEYSYIEVVEMPDNESMAAYVQMMSGSGHYSAGKTTPLDIRLR